MTIDRIIALANRLRPTSADDTAMAERNVWGEIARLTKHPEEATALAQDLQALLALPQQTAFFAETSIRSALGFWLELSQRLGQRLLPPAPDDSQLLDILRQVFHDPSDHEWISAVSDETWLELAAAIGLYRLNYQEANANIHEAIRVLSYRIAGTALDRELLRAEPSLERHESPFLAQSAALVPMLERIRAGGAALELDEVRELDVLLDQCTTLIERVRRKAGENGVSIRLTHLLARLRQLISRLHELLDLTVAENQAQNAIRLFKTLVTAVQTSHHVQGFIGESVSLMARNITDHASRHGEHYIAEDRAAWWAMARSAAGGGMIIGIMAMLKIQLSQLHLPPLTEGIAFGLNYGIGFVLIHLLGFVVATKQPAMTAAAIAATLQEARPRDLERLGDLVQNVVRTQFVAVLGNVGLAVPMACLIALVWPIIFGVPAASPEKAMTLLHDLDPLHSGALFFAGFAGVGLFLSGLVSGYFDNQARYDHLPARIAHAPALKWLGEKRSRRLGGYLDAHYGAILGNLFFGMYLGVVGVLGKLTGLPVDIRHVAFGSANVGTSAMLLDSASLFTLLPWAVAGVIGIALINLIVSFTLALYVAMKSRGLGMRDVLQLASLLLKRFVQAPLGFFTPPPRLPPEPESHE